MEKDKGNRRCWLDPASVTPRIGGGYPKPFDEPTKGREKRALGNTLGLTQFGVNLTTLRPFAWSSQPHWHKNEDEFVYVLEGDITLVTDTGETVLSPGMAAGFPAGNPDGHHLINRSDKPALYLEIGTRLPGEVAHYIGHQSWRAPGRRSLRLHPQERRAVPMTFGGRMARAPFLGLIALYRWTVSPLLGVNCRHLPSCSDYAREAIEMNGAWKGGWLALARLCRCHPWGSHGFDPVPDLRAEHHPFAPWRYGHWRVSSIP